MKRCKLEMDIKYFNCNYALFASRNNMDINLKLKRYSGDGNFSFSLSR